MGLTAAEVRGTATFYDMLFTEPVGRHLISVCTNIACLLTGGYELLEHAEQTLGVRAGGTTTDGEFTLEEVECIALCGNAPCLTVNWRFFGDVTHEGFDRLVDELRAGRLRDTVPPHGTLCRVRRSVGLPAEEHGADPGGGRAETATAGEGGGGDDDQPARTEGSAGGYPEAQPGQQEAVAASEAQEPEVRTPGGVDSAGGISPGAAGDTVGTGKAVPGGRNPAPEEKAEAAERAGDSEAKAGDGEAKAGDGEAKAGAGDPKASSKGRRRPSRGKGKGSGA